MQECCQIERDDTEESLEERVKILCEHKAYPRGLEMVASGQASLDVDGKILWKIS